MSSIQIQEHDCDNIVAASWFDEDRKSNTMPHYAFYTPNLNNDGPDKKLPHASKWLNTFLKPLLMNQTFMRGH